MIYKREDYFEENEGDQRFPVKHVEVLVPIDGSPAQFVGQVTIGLSTPLGLQQIPVTFEIQARDVREAFQKFASAAEPQIEEARKSIEEEISRLRHEASSRIVTPGELGISGGSILGGQGGPGGPPPGVGSGGGRIVGFNRPR
jgi:hypothetical protein